MDVLRHISRVPHIPTFDPTCICLTQQPILGLFSPAMSGMTAFNGSPAYSMCCLVRDLNNYTASTWMATSEVDHRCCLQQHPNLTKEFQGRFPDGSLRIRTSGHLHVGCDVGSLLLFLGRPCLLQTMLDYVYLNWLSLHLGEAFIVAGTITMRNNPPSKDTSLNDTLGLH